MYKDRNMEGQNMEKFAIFAIMSMVILLTGLNASAEEKSTDNKQTTENKERKSLKILGIGNSFLLNATNMLPSMVKSHGHELTLGIARLSSLQSHYTAAYRAENPENPEGKRYRYPEPKSYKYQGGWWGKDKKETMTLKEMLTGLDWDYVTIQQNSPNSYKIDTYRPVTRNLCDYIKKYAPQAEIVFHQTWPWRPDNPRNGMNKNPEGFMYRNLTRCYYTIAKEVGIKKIIPAGNAFQLAEESPEWKFQRDPNFDYDNPVYPEKPKEKNSLHGGWSWRNKGGGKKVLKLDGSHLGGGQSGGCALAAYVWYEFFFGDDVRKFTSSPSNKKIAALRKFAHQAVAGVRPKAWPEDIE